MRTPTRLTVIDDALEAIELLRPLIQRVRAQDKKEEGPKARADDRAEVARCATVMAKSLADQIRRAASSVVLNLGEAAYSDPGNRRARLHSACGSANETRIALRTAAAWGYIDDVQADRADRKLDVVVAKTYRWLNPKR